MKNMATNTENYIPLQVPSIPPLDYGVLQRHPSCIPTQRLTNMTAEMANNYILATDAAYKYGGSVEKLNAALDGANYISNKNSASLTDIADATLTKFIYSNKSKPKIISHFYNVA